MIISLHGHFHCRLDMCWNFDFAHTDLFDGRSEANCGFFENYSSWSFHMSKTCFWLDRLFMRNQTGWYGGKRGSEMEIEKTTNFHIWKARTKRRRLKVQCRNIFPQDYNLLKWVQSKQRVVFSGVHCQCGQVCNLIVTTLTRRHSRRHAAGPTMQS